MTDFARLVLASDTRGLRDARGELDRLTRTGSRTESRVNRSMNAMGASFRAVAVQAASMVAAFAGVGAALRGSQEIQQITNGLRALGMTTEEASAALDDLAAISDRTRAPLTATAQLYRRVSIAGRDLGASQSDVLRFTENVGLALGATGISAQEASGALLQLSQAMAGGTVRAEEFNSILEGAFPIAQAAADGIDAAGGSVGRLRAMVIAGEVSSREFFEAIIGQTDALQDSFNQTEETIGQAVTALGDDFALLARETDSAFGVSSAITAGISLLGDNLDLVRAGILGTATVITAYYTPAILAATLGTNGLIASLVTLRGALMATGFGVAVVAAGYLIDSLFNLRSATGSWGESLSALGDLASGVWEGITTSAQAMQSGIQATWNFIKAGFLSMIAEIQWRWSSFLGDIALATREIPGFGDEIGDQIASVSRRAAESWEEYNAAASKATSAAEGFRAENVRLREEGFDKAREALARLTEILNSEGDASSAATTEAQKLKEALDGMGGEGGAAGKAAAGLSDADKEVQRLGDSSDRTADRFGDMVASIVTGSRSISDVLQGMLGQLISGGISTGISGLASGDGPLAKIASVFAGTFDGGGMISGGKFGIVGERGPELVSGPARVTSRVDTARMMGGGRVINNISITAPPGSDIQESRQENSTGGEDLTVLIDRTVSGLARDPGSAISRTLNTGFGVGRTTRSR